MNNNQCVNILWTGGWDSTFRMIQLARESQYIQPFYIIDTKRPSTLKEISQIQKIKYDLSKKYLGCEIKEVKFIELNSIEIDKTFKLAYDKLRQESFMGSQYLWIGALSWQIENLELSIHQDDKAEYFARQLFAEKEGTPIEELKLLFGQLKFPLLNYTKLDMKKEAVDNQDIEILNKSWFCFTPINNQPCGVCNPCKYSLAEGMDYRFSTRAKLYSKIPHTIKSLRRRVYKIL